MLCRHNFAVFDPYLLWLNFFINGSTGQHLLLLYQKKGTYLPTIICSLTLHFFLNLLYISMVKSVLALLKMESKSLIKAAIMTAIIIPRSPKIDSVLILMESKSLIKAAIMTAIIIPRSPKTNSVLILLKMESKSLIEAAIMTAIIIPRSPKTNSVLILLKRSLNHSLRLLS